MKLLQWPDPGRVPRSGTSAETGKIDAPAGSPSPHPYSDPAYVEKWRVFAATPPTLGQAAWEIWHSVADLGYFAWARIVCRVRGCTPTGEAWPSFCTRCFQYCAPPPHNSDPVSSKTEA